MPATIISLLISIIPMIPSATAEGINFIKMVRDLVNGAPAADQPALAAQWAAMRQRVTDADAAWQAAGI